MKYFKIGYLSVSIFVVASTLAWAQQKTSDAVKEYFETERIQYNTPFDIGSIDSIKTVIARIRDYFNAGTPFKIIDRTTNKIITDFSKLNQNADNDNGDHGLFNLWNGGMHLTTVDTICRLRGNGRLPKNAS